MPDQRQSEVLGALPRTRPQRRSSKRPVRATAGETSAAPPTSVEPRAAEPAKGPGTPAASGRQTKRPDRSPSRQTAKRAAKPGRAAKQRSAPKAKPRAVAATPRASGSQRRPASAGASKSGGRSKSKADPLRQPPQPRGIPRQPRAPVPSTHQRPEVLGTVVQAAAELTEIGLSLGAHVLRRAVARLPRP